ncbi:MAG: transcriptional repressor [Anaerolineae bacterium]|nr:transcriptional repressor [Anaerolineae bacterium]
MSQDEMVAALRQAGYRLTRPRLAVLQVLLEHQEQLSPEELHHLGKAVYAPLGLVTVYRTLELLDRLGLAQRVHTAGRCHGYARIAGDHHHLVCRGCARVVEFPCEGLDALIAHVRQTTGFIVDSHLLELSGLCPNCQSL